MKKKRNKRFAWYYNWEKGFWSHKGKWTKVKIISKNGDRYLVELPNKRKEIIGSSWLFF